MFTSNSSASDDSTAKIAVNSSVAEDLPFVSVSEFDNLHGSKILSPSSITMTNLTDSSHFINNSSSLCQTNEVTCNLSPEIEGSVANSMVSTIAFENFDSADCQQLSCSNFLPEMCGLEDSKKQNHSEIEKRRRDKMNHYIVELSRLIPMCGAMPRKLDKLTVLKMALQHIKALRSSLETFSGGVQEKPSFLSDEILMDLISKTSDGFLFVVSCEGAKILYVSQSVSKVLNYSQEELIAQNWFNFLHHKDVSKVKEQLSSSDLFPKEKLIDAKTMLPIKTRLPPKAEWRCCPGARRSFFCRMKYKSLSDTNEESETSSRVYKKSRSNSADEKYCVLHCVGYLTALCSERINAENEFESESESINCLVTVDRTLPKFSPQSASDIELMALDFVSRHAKDGKFLFVEHRATFVLGYLEQELLGTTFYEYCHPEDTKILLDSIKSVLQLKSNHSISRRCRFRTKCGSYIWIQTTWKLIANPWTKDFEFFVTKSSCCSNSDSMDNSADSKFRIITKNNVPIPKFFGNFDDQTNKIDEISTECEERKMSAENSIQSSMSKIVNEANVVYNERSAIPNSFSASESSERQNMQPNLLSDICCNEISQNENVVISSKSFVDVAISNEGDQIMNFWSNVSNITSSNDCSSSSNSSNADLLAGYNGFEKSVECCRPSNLTGHENDETDETIALIKSLLEGNTDLTTVDFNGIN